MPKMTGMQFVAEAIRGYGVTHVFYVPQMLLDTLVAMEGWGIKRVMTHGEKAAAYMADGYARASRKPGICFAQHVGGSNLAAGLKDAYLACSPVIAMTGGPAPLARHRHAYQEIEDYTQFEHTTKFNAHVDSVDRLPDLIRQAFREATTGCPGPVHLEMRGHHAEVAHAEAELKLIVEDRYKQVPPFRPAGDPAQVAAAVKLLEEAERPIIVAGGGVAWSQAQAEVVKLAEQLSIPVATSLNAKGAILDTHALSVGVVGTYSRTSANKSVGEADLVFFIGSHTGGQVTARWQVPKVGTRVIHLDIDAAEIGRNYPTELALLGDAKTVLQQMIAVGGGKNKHAAWLGRVNELKKEFRDAVAANVNSDDVPMRPERVCREITEALPENGVIVCDTGHSGIWSGTMIDFTKPGQRLIRCAGSLGWGGRTVWRFEKDGSLKTLASHYQGKKINSPNDIVVRDDGQIYFTDSPGGMLNVGMVGYDLQKYLDIQGVYRIALDGSLHLVTDDFVYPNGLCFSPDEKILYVNCSRERVIRAYDVNPDGSCGPGRLFYKYTHPDHGNPDGLKCDVEGNVYCTGPGGVWVHKPDGSVLLRLKLKGHATNIGFGDDDWRSLYITMIGSVTRTRLKIPGVAAR